MKRTLFVVFVFLLLVACGTDDSTELEQFTNDFNEAAETRDVPKLNLEEFGEIEIEDNRGWQVLFDSSNYTIDAKYEDGENLSGYYLVINENDPFELLSSEGYWAGVAIARALGLDTKNYMDEFSKALEITSHSYTDSEYIISFTNPGEDGLTSVGIIINFDKR